jgi:leader peptidase (prepilin peptidase) / N-methyltransferase
MPAIVHNAAWLIALVLASGLVLLPRPLFAEAGETKPSRRLELSLVLGLAVIGSAAFYVVPDMSLGEQLVLAAALMVLTAVAYSDLRYLVIPDLYSGLLAIMALIGPLTIGLGAAIVGALACGGLLALVAWAWRHSTEVEGLGFGDVKLAAALGGLLGAEHGMWAIAGSALTAGAMALGARALRLRRAEEGPLMIPYGAALAAFAAGILVWTRL